MVCVSGCAEAKSIGDGDELEFGDLEAAAFMMNRFWIAMFHASEYLDENYMILVSITI